MKKASKILTLLLVAVMVLSLFAGCGIFGKNTEKYRSTLALKVGSQEITVGKLIDTFNNYYNTYAGYVSQGYITVDYIFQMTVASLYSQYMKIDDYIQSGAKTYTHTTDRGGVHFANEQYLDNGEDGIDELDYAIKYIKYVLFTTLDSMTETLIAGDYDLGEAKEDERDTSRDFTEFDDLKGATTYSRYTYEQNFENEDMDKYIDKYYKGILKTTTIDVEEYIYVDADKNSDMITTRLKELNERIEDADPINFENYTEYQKQALEQYKRNVLSSYKYDLTALITRQVEDFISSSIVTKWNYSKYSEIDGTADGLAATMAKLREDLAKNTSSQKTDFNINENFVSYVESLSSGKYLYDVPRDSDGNQRYNYVYVKNILIPFTSEQTTTLSNIEQQLGTKDDVRGLYKAKLLELASQVIADDFNSEKDEDDKYATIKNIFAVNNGELVINTADTEAYEAFGKYFTAADGRVNEADIKALMARFNTDTAQHTAAYDYVVRVGAVPESYQAKWVSEFVDATNDAVIKALGWDSQIGAGLRFATKADAVKAISAADLATVKPGTYGLAISTYGVHVVYFSGVVTEYNFDFEAKWLDTSSFEYKLFKDYYSTQSSKVLEEALEALQKVYYVDKISKTSELDKFAKDNGFTFDFEESLKLDD